MSYSFDILDWYGVAPGLCSSDLWQQWSSSQNYNWNMQQKVVFKKIPMMVARRMSSSSKMALETALQLLEKHTDIDAAVFVSRHGELDRTYHIIKDLVSQKDPSPTSFTMSVHNTSAGLFTIEAKKNIPVSSLSAGADSFQQGLLEVQAMLHSGKNKVLLIDFDGNVPAAYRSRLLFYQDGLVYALGMVIVKGNSCICQQQIKPDSSVVESLPQSLIFLKHYLLKKKSFNVVGCRTQWQWSLNNEV
ncbi:beta-ketoacyl synthase chain length factor [Entomomonas moraniae]|uniref:beta-ketoacyl synthase chain length factor n=1 Tax=Entomomonas moraniae TaxID=2213226 RepID=UPI0013E0BA1D|nr:beta-ketoacyl synthase chain length factor [Entomomonas moraniae]